MKIAVLGTGTVGSVMSARLTELGHEVTVGAREASSETLVPFQAQGVATGSFDDAAAASELVINATNGNHSATVFESISADSIVGKTVIDLANKLDHSKGMAAAAIATTENSVALEIKEAAPGANVVKALNTMNSSVMVKPSAVPGDHVVFVSGDSDDAKSQVKALLAEFGWNPQQIIDLGGLETATGPEMLMQLWLDVVVARGGFAAGPFNFAINS